MTNIRNNDQTTDGQTNSPSKKDVQGKKKTLRLNRETIRLLAVKTGIRTASQPTTEVC